METGILPFYLYADGIFEKFFLRFILINGPRKLTRWFKGSEWLNFCHGRKDSSTPLRRLELMNCLIFCRIPYSRLLWVSRFIQAKSFISCSQRKECPRYEGENWRSCAAVSLVWNGIRFWWNKKFQLHIHSMKAVDWSISFLKKLYFLLTQLQLECGF